jgi:FlgD Ig-like domain
MPRSRHAASHAGPDRHCTCSHGAPKTSSGLYSRRRVLAVLLTVLAVLAGTAGVLGSRHAPRLASDASTATLFGSSASNPSLLSQATSEFGHMQVVRVFYPGLPSSNAWTTGAPALSKAAVVVSFKALASTILAGTDDSALSHFFDAAPSGHPVYYSYYPEPERFINAGLFSVSQFKAAWAHIVSLANAAHNPALHSTLILTSYDLSPQSGRNWKDYLPSGNVISTLGWDAYPAGTIQDSNPQLTPPATFMGPAIAASRSVGLPFGFAEFALGTPAGRPGWLAEVGDYLANQGAVFGTLFNSAGWPWMQLNDSASIGAWRAVVARSGLNTPVAPQPTPAPAAPATVGITGLALSPSAFGATGANHVTITFNLTQAADVTVCVLDSQGTIVRQLARPGRGAGQVTIAYYGGSASGQLLPAGHYWLLVVASNSHGSDTAEAGTTITGP